MFVLLGVLLGAIIGATIAKRRKGKPLDILQYAVIYAMIFAIIGLFLTIAAHRLAL
ncbi:MULTISPECIES: hypothetical protein [Shimia]|uniref:hypothetical protein n=1 Tax=Shimia TaxID=573139 RepID=UPI001FB47340|nr:MULTISPECIES: hypothetical protein [Shimia]MDV4144030.1 hypothetical protein [Shimia sp. FJ5]